MNSLRIKRAKKFIDNLSNIKELEFTAFLNQKRHVYHLLTAYCVKKINISQEMN